MSTALGLPAFLLLLLLNAIWAASSSFMEYGMRALQPVHLVLGRMSLAWLTLLILCLVKYGIPRLHRKVVMRGLLLGVFTGLGHWIAVSGIRYSSAMDASILMGVEPILTIIMACFILKEPVSYRLLIATVLVMIGFAFLVNIKWGNTNAMRLLGGNGLILLGFMTDAAFSIVTKPLMKHSPAPMVMWVVLTGCILVLLPASILTTAWTASKWARPEGWVAIAYLGWLCSVVAFTTWLWVLRRGSITWMTITIFFQPVIGVMVAHFWLHQQITTEKMIGTSFILLALAMSIDWRHIKLSKVIVTPTSITLKE